MRLAASKGHTLERAEFSHRVSVDWVEFEAGLDWWRPRCKCGWKLSIAISDSDTAIELAVAHTRGFIWGMGRSPDDLLESS